MTTPTAESIEKAHSLLIEGESVADQVEAIALALDNARAEGIKQARDAVNAISKGDNDPRDAGYFYGIDGALDAIDSLAPAKTKGTE